jgi:hypothetical protein|eukprot:COSAG01_NODE_604_length_14894_cov_24.503211_15_plen_167_part_00
MARASAEFGCAFETAWHPYFLDVTLPPEGVTKRESYRAKGMNEASLAKMERSMGRTFSSEGLSFTLDGETGNTVDSHRLAAWVYTTHGAEVQNRLVDVLFRQFFSEGLNPVRAVTMHLLLRKSGCLTVGMCSCASVGASRWGGSGYHRPPWRISSPQQRRWAYRES